MSADSAFTVTQRPEILVLDPSESEATVLACLCGVWGYAGLPTTSIEDAVRFAARRTLAAAIVDTHFPWSGGLVAALKIHLAAPATPVLLTGAVRPGPVLIRALRCGVVGFLRKPVSPAALGKYLRTVAG